MTAALIQARRLLDTSPLPALAGGAVLVVLAVQLATLATETMAATAGASSSVAVALTAAGIAALATTLGALPALLLRDIPRRAEDVLLGFAGGVMLAASAFSLLLPSVEAGTSLFGGRMPAAMLAAVGLATGALLMLGIDRVLPHEHRAVGRAGPPSRLARVWLLVIAILIHNFPEGMAIGAAFSGNEPAAGVPVAAAIAIQDIPEGLVVALALRSIGFHPGAAVLAAGATGLAEPLGAAAASLVLGLVPSLYPFGLALAAGAMIFVVSHELIPETHRNGHQTPATAGLIGGFAMMMVLDTALVA
jgi:ZIP family zinc transporter